ncbi:hypothetical protein [Paenibacillus gansuensis]|uniref:IDEAL domain-containing protein n=1 Tax=Paenibacillus gansuensis TaxID=306542 RepID=A0ABW5PIK0_9BACL
MTAEESLKRTYPYEVHIYFRYFAECYLIPSVKFENIRWIIEDLKNRENKDLIDGLAREAKLLRDKENWDYVKKFIKKHALRSLDKDKPKI